MNEQFDALAPNDGRVKKNHVVSCFNGEYGVKAIGITNEKKSFTQVGVIEKESVNTPTFQKNDDGRILLTGIKLRTYMANIFNVLQSNELQQLQLNINNKYQYFLESRWNKENRHFA